MTVEIQILGILRGKTGIQPGPEAGVHVLQLAGPGHQGAEEQVAAVGAALDGEIEIDGAVRIQAGLQLIKNIAIARLGTQIIDGIEHVLRVQVVDGLEGMKNLHEKTDPFRAEAAHPGRG